MARKSLWKRVQVALLATAAVALAAPAVLHPPAAVAGEESPDAVHRVKVSAVHEDRETFHFTAFYPNKLQVHAGDSVQWEFLGSYAGWHSVTFAPSDMDVAKSPQPRYPTEIGDAWGIEESGLVKLPDAFSLGSPDGFFGDGTRCGRGANPALGWPAQEPCVLSGTDELVGSSISDAFFGTSNSPLKTFNLEVAESMPAGSYRYHCLIHPAMVGELEVVPGDQPLDLYTAEEFEADLASDVANAQEVADRLGDPARAYDPETGEWTVHVTESTEDGRVAIMEYLPANLEVRPGDKVNFVAGGEGPGSEPNTVTFPSEVGGGFCQTGGPTTCTREQRVVGFRPLGATAFIWGCDADDLNGGVPMTPLAPWFAGDGTSRNRCPSGTQLEWTVAPYMSHGQPAPDNAVLSPATFHNSGAMVPVDSPASWFRERGDGTQFPSTFEASFPTTGAFPYKCLAHPDFMAGTVTVTQ